MSRTEWVMRGPAQRRQSPALKDYAWEREQQRMRQISLLEALRWKYDYAKHPSTLMRRLWAFADRWGLTWLGAWRDGRTSWIPRHD